MLDDDSALGLSGERAPAELETIAVPPTIQALLAERLDRLNAAERAVIEAASIEGKEFGRERVEALIGDAIDAEISALVRKDLIEPFREDTFRFRHQLIRDAAYDGMSKELRAHLHERFADWLEARPMTFTVVDELARVPPRARRESAARARRGAHEHRAACGAGIGEPGRRGPACRPARRPVRCECAARARDRPGPQRRCSERGAAAGPSVHRSSKRVG